MGEIMTLPDGTILEIKGPCRVLGELVEYYVQNRMSATVFAEHSDQLC